MVSLWTGPRSRKKEWLDRPEAIGPEDARAVCRGLSRVNSLPGGWRLSRRYLEPLIRRAARQRGGEAVTLCDVGTGGGDFAVRMARWAARQGIALQVLAVEADPHLAAVARGQAAEATGVYVVEADARLILEAAARGSLQAPAAANNNEGIPAAASRFDVVFCGLMMHHYEPEEVAGWLRLFSAASSVGWVVQDLERSRVGQFTARALAPLLCAHRFFRHDAPLSFSRAYTEREWKRLARESRAGRCRVARHAPWRIVVQGNGTRRERGSPAANP